MFSFGIKIKKCIFMRLSINVTIIQSGENPRNLRRYLWERLNKVYFNGIPIML